MKKFYHFRDYQRAKLESHAFYKLIDSDIIPLKNKLMFAPVMAHFVMNFRDMNKWVIRFATTDSKFKSVINAGTTEDETHSRLFLEDWRKLYLDDKLNWKASDIIYWLFISPEMECFRKYGVEFMRLCVDDNNDPILRYSHSESGETCGNVFFSKISPIADEVAHELGVQLRYFGSFHLDLENGHVWKSEGVFENEVLLPEYYDKVRNLSQRMFDIFTGIHDAFYHYTLKYIVKHEVHNFSNLVKTEGKILTPPSEINITQTQKNNEEIIHYVDSYLREIDEHPFFDWVKSSTINAELKIKYFIPLWIVDIMMYRDINNYIFTYMCPGSMGEILINDYARHLACHSALFYNDWKALKLDDMLRWSASDTLEFIFLNTDMDSHRKNLVNFSLHGMKNKDPLIRFWFMMILELSGKSFFSVIGQVAMQAESECNISLPYLTGKHSSAEEQKSYCALYEYFINQDISKEQVKTIKYLSDIVMRSLLENLDISYKYALNNIFAAR